MVNLVAGLPAVKCMAQCKTLQENYTVHSTLYYTVQDTVLHSTQYSEMNTKSNQKGISGCCSGRAGQIKAIARVKESIAAPAA